MSMLRTLVRKLRRAVFRAPHLINCLEFEAFVLDYLEGDLLQINAASSSFT